MSYFNEVLEALRTINPKIAALLSHVSSIDIDPGMNGSGKIEGVGLEFNFSTKNTFFVNELRKIGAKETIESAVLETKNEKADVSFRVRDAPGVDTSRPPNEWLTVKQAYWIKDGGLDGNHRYQVRQLCAIYNKTHNQIISEGACYKVYRFQFKECGHPSGEVRQRISRSSIPSYIKAFTPGHNGGRVATGIGFADMSRLPRGGCKKCAPIEQSKPLTKKPRVDKEQVRLLQKCQADLDAAKRLYGLTAIEYRKRLRSLPYEVYLTSDHWIDMKNSALDAANHKCTLCCASREHYTLCVHHRSFDNLGRETLEDLVVLCADCHARHHGKV